MNINTDIPTISGTDLVAFEAIEGGYAMRFYERQQDTGKPEKCKAQITFDSYKKCFLWCLLVYKTIDQISTAFDLMPKGGN